MNIFKTTPAIVLVFAFAGIIFLINPINAAENIEKNSCIDCHKTLSPFLDVERQFNQIREQHLEINVSCSLECHSDRIRQLATANYQQWSDSIHALKKVTCDDCHGGSPNETTKEKAHVGILNVTDINSSVYYTNVPKTCGKCHSTELINFQSSKHYQKLESLQTAPTCTTCHSPHTFSILNPEEFRNFCTTCHSAYTKVAPYDIPVQAEYLLSKVNKLKFDIQTTQQDIFWAKKNGTDTTNAEKYVNNALTTVQDLPPMWHEFNFSNFENVVDSASNQTKMADDIVVQNPSPTQTTVKVAPGFGILTSIIVILVLVLATLRAKKKKV